MPSVSKSQQRLMGVAYAVKSGDMEINDVDPAYREKVKGLVDGMTKKDLKKYASTKHEDLPETVDEMAGTGAVSLNPGQTIGGMGDITLPVNGELGSGDLPHAVIQVADIDDDLEKEKKRNKKKVVKNLEMEKFNIYTQFNDFLNEATDYNDPVLIRLRQDKLRRADMAKLDALKKEAEKDRKKAMRRWNQKKYDQWLEDVASNDGWKNAYDMAQNAEFEPGLIDWVKKEFPYDDAYQRIQWDIEAFAESVVTEGVLSDVRKAVEKTKKTLKKKWAAKGGYENFGQDEIRDLEDKYDYSGMVYGTPEERKAAKLIDALDQWAMNYVGESEVTEGKYEDMLDQGDGHVHFIVKDEAAAEKLADAIEAKGLGDCDFYPEDGKIYLRVSFSVGYSGKEVSNLKKVEKLVGMKAQAGSPEIWAADESVVNEKKLDRDEMMAWIKRTMDFVKTTEEFNGSPGGIWVCGECGDEYKGRIIYSYYSEDYKNRTFGVDNKWEKELNKRGWYSEWHDAGTSMIWPN